MCDVHVFMDVVVTSDGVKLKVEGAAAKDGNL